MQTTLNVFSECISILSFKNDNTRINRMTPKWINDDDKNLFIIIIWVSSHSVWLLVTPLPFLLMQWYSWPCSWGRGYEPDWGSMSCEVLVTPFSHWEYWEPRVLGLAMPCTSPLKGLWLEPTLWRTVLRGTTGYSLVLRAGERTNTNG